MLLWCEGFDHYGSDTVAMANMVLGAWAEVQDTGFISGTGTPGPRTLNPRTGTHGFLVGQTANRVFRRVLGAAYEVVGWGYALYNVALPTTSSIHRLGQLRDSTNAPQCSFGLTTDGRIEFRRGAALGGTLLGTSGQVIVASSYQHLEFRVRVHDTLGEAEARVNGVTVLSLSGIDTKNTSEAGASQIAWGNENNNGANVRHMDDLFVWNDQGDYNNDFIGDRRVATLFPTGDLSPTDWVRNTGSDDFAAIDDAAPDSETTYIAASVPGGSPPVNPISEFIKTALPGNIAGISAVQLVSFMRKTDAGACNVQASLVSSDVGSPPAPAVASGADRPITEAYTYYHDVLETDPATGAPWTPDAVDNAILRYERTT